MKQTASIDELRSAVCEWHDSGERVALVPTMGNLHKGHVSLVRHAASLADRVIVSVFVNPTQFGEGEDYEDYPRTLDEDRRVLGRAKTDLLFTPRVDDVYPFGQHAATHVHVPELTDELCGRSRPGHFDGVVSVVARLFCMALPDLAVFGRKDYQQLLVIRRFVSDMSIPIEVEAFPTVREHDSLAVSSRNQYLSPAQRRLAPRLYRTLAEAAAIVSEGRRDFEAIESESVKQLEACGFAPDYVAIRSAATLSRLVATGDSMIVLGAARLGQTRLIDNIEVQLTNR